MPTTNGTTKHVLVWDQPGAEQKAPKKKGWYGTRHFVTLMLFFGMANAYTMRTNMSVAIVAMVNHTALPKLPTVVTDECADNKFSNETQHDNHKDGEYLWTTAEQGYILSSFFYGYCITQIPCGILAKKYGALRFLAGGMMLNSLFGFLVPTSATFGTIPLIIVRFIQGLGEGPIVPCTHAMLAKWIPPNERSRMAAIVYAGAQFGTVVSMPLSGILSDMELFGGWPSIFYFFGGVSAIWSIVFFFTVYEDPDSHPHIDADERKHIINTVWGAGGVSSPPVPWTSIGKSMPFWAILIAHIGQNYGYETLMTELPTFMKQVLRFNIKKNGFLSALPYLAMWGFSVSSSWVADYMISHERLSHTKVRKIAQGIGHFGPAIALIGASYTGCNPALTVAILTVGVGLNGGIYSGFKVNHLDISPRFAGILMSFTNFTANMAGLLAPIIAGYIIHGRPNQEAWREVFFVASSVYFVCNCFYLIFASSKRQPWDDPSTDAPPTPSTPKARNVAETAH
ncbi:putative inorganic phosphate cotransporter isoform X2 [Halyomorpha halys]|uniref:putative inorganic phosphate cotransporter isoform X2 n=1 Tax=Halyomorpha halys TaxID=286706 RepID=UPI0006D5213A|nr:putative inorganic phosphate cotransporter isoform X2 [Halyomorpha halys]